MKMFLKIFQPSLLVLIIVVLFTSCKNKIEDVWFEGIEITSLPAKTIYTAGEPFNKDGLVVTAKYSDGSKVIVTNDVVLRRGYMGDTLNDGNIDITASPSQETIMVCYDRTWEYFDIMVMSEDAYMSLEQMPEKIFYLQGEAFSSIGFDVEIWSRIDDNTSSYFDVTDYVLSWNDEVLRDGNTLITSTLGLKEVIVSFLKFTDTFSIAVANPEYIDINSNGVNLSFAMINVKGGTFTMGCTEELGADCYDMEKPAHQVTLSDFSIGQMEVTQALWFVVMDNLPEMSEWRKGDSRPVHEIGWSDIIGSEDAPIGYTINGITYYQNGFCYKLSQLVSDGKQFRLPTEAEWEYAARGGSVATVQTLYSGNNDVNAVAWYAESDNFTPHLIEVGKKQPNALGIYDMSGNIYERCSDWYGAYSVDALIDPIGPSEQSADAYGPLGRIVRGGSTFWGLSNCRVSLRNGYRNDWSHWDIGFRLACSQ